MNTVTNITTKNESEIEKRIQERLAAEADRIRKELEAEEARKLEKERIDAENEEKGRVQRSLRNAKVHAVLVEVFEALRSFDPSAKEPKNYLEDGWHGNYSMSYGQATINFEYFQPTSGSGFRSYKNGPEYLRCQIFGSWDEKTGWKKEGKHGFDAKKLADDLVQMDNRMTAIRKREEEKAQAANNKKNALAEAFDLIREAGYTIEHHPAPEPLYKYATDFRVQTEGQYIRVKVSDYSSEKYELNLTVSFDRMMNILAAIREGAL